MDGRLNRFSYCLHLPPKGVRQSAGLTRSSRETVITKLSKVALSICNVLTRGSMFKRENSSTQAAYLLRNTETSKSLVEFSELATRIY